MNNETTAEIKELLQNAIDYGPQSEYHLGYSAKEIHRKSLAHIILLSQIVDTLLAERDGRVYKLGWGKGKDE